VRLGDADTSGRLRFDALARYLQDVSNDDTRDSRFGDPMGWVVRRSVVDVIRPAEVFDVLTLRTFCGGTGQRWAERRVSVTGAAGASIEAATLWVHVDLDTMTPKRLSPEFMALFGESAGGRTVRARLLHPPPPSGATRRPWPLRATDYDLLDHVNNAIYWVPVEEVLASRPDLRGGPLRAEVEFPAPIDRGGAVALVVDERADGFGGWLVSATTPGLVHSSAVVRRHGDG
jgi:acyl-ACP thioesterase